MKLRTTALLLLMLALSSLLPFPVSGAEGEDLHSLLLRGVPARPDRSLTGSEFAKAIAETDRDGREAAIERELDAGNIPAFLRNLKEIHFRRRTADGKTTELTLFAMPDYLAIGSDRDYLLIPMSLPTALEVAARYGFLLPTRTIVDAIFSQSDFHFRPQPLPAGPRMRSTAYFVAHNLKILQQRLSLCCSLGELVSGHKKDVVLTSRLARQTGRIAIYGWHQPSGNPIQPLSLVHGDRYVDYSHGIRLIAGTALVDGQPRSLYEVLEEPELAPLVSDEGPLAFVRGLLARYRNLLALSK